MKLIAVKTRRRQVWILSVATSLVIGCVAGFAGWALQTWAQSGEIPIPSTDRTRASVAHFEAGNHVYVAPDGRRYIDEAAQQRLEAQAAASSHPIYIMVWSWGESQSEWTADVDVARTIDQDGFYLTYAGPENNIGVTQFGRNGVDLDLWGDLLGEPEKRLSEVIEEVSNADPERNSITYRPEEDAIHKGEVEFGSGRPMAFIAGLFIGLLSLMVLVPLMFAIEWGVRRARR